MVEKEIDKNEIILKNLKLTSCHIFQPNLQQCAIIVVCTMIFFIASTIKLEKGVEVRLAKNIRVAL